MAPCERQPGRRQRKKRRSLFVSPLSKKGEPIIPPRPDVVDATSDHNIGYSPRILVARAGAAEAVYLHGRVLSQNPSVVKPTILSISRRLYTRTGDVVSVPTDLTFTF